MAARVNGGPSVKPEPAQESPVQQQAQEAPDVEAAVEAGPDAAAAPSSPALSSPDVSMEITGQRMAATGRRHVCMHMSVCQLAPVLQGNTDNQLAFCYNQSSLVCISEVDAQLSIRLQAAAALRAPR